VSRFAGKSVIVTGGASGIGLACAERMGSEGASVMLADRDLAAADAALERVREAGAERVRACLCDVADEAAVAACVDGAIEHFGGLHAIVNNAGLMTFKPLAELDQSDWWRVLSVDLLGAFHFIKHALRRMSRGGAVVNVSSVHAIETSPNVAPYAAAKAALVSLTRSAAIECGEKGLRFNAVLPGAVDTKMLWANPNVAAGIEAIEPANVGDPSDVAAVIAFLASDDAKFVQGAAVVVDGGRVDRL
jgi:NAD(P)-dependent dehydrogenase (short-subunit alcohol dehydrogenase family)